MPFASHLAEASEFVSGSESVVMGVLERGGTPVMWTHGDKGHMYALCRVSSPYPRRTFHPRRCSPPSLPPAALARREEESLAIPTKRRRVTAEMEGKYIINMPKGTTPRTRKILEQQQAAKGTGLRGACFGQTLFPFGCIVQGWPRPTGIGRETGSNGIQGALDGGDCDGGRRRGGQVTTSALLSCS